MDTTHTEALIGMVAVLGILALVLLPALIGIAHDWRVDRRIREAQEVRGSGSGQKSSSKPTEPSTATWYAEGRRSKKLVSS
jgi:hypothetical protein